MPGVQAPGTDPATQTGSKTMIVDEANFKGDSPLAQEAILLVVQTVAISQNDVKADSCKPGYPFQVVSVEHFAEDIAATASYDVKIGTTSALNAAAVPVADTRGDAALSGTLANLQGSASDEINLHVTTDGTGTLTGLKVRVTIRPQGTR